MSPCASKLKRTFDQSSSCPVCCSHSCQTQPSWFMRQRPFQTVKEEESACGATRRGYFHRKEVLSCHCRPEPCLLEFVVVCPFSDHLQHLLLQRSGDPNRSLLQLLGCRKEALALLIRLCSSWIHRCAFDSLVCSDDLCVSALDLCPDRCNTRRGQHPQCLPALRRLAWPPGLLPARRVARTKLDSDSPGDLHVLFSCLDGSRDNLLGS